MSDLLAKEKTSRLLKKRGSVSSIEYRRSSLGSHDVRAKDRTRDSTTVSYMDDPGHHDDNGRVQMENTYQIVPSTRFPIAMVTEILRDVLTSYLQQEQYEADLCRQMTKTICEVIKARVKELMIPRYKIIVQVNIGQLNDQNMRIVSRCLWDASNDNYASHTFKNISLFAVANVYTVYFE